MAVSQSCNRWAVAVEIVTPTADTYLDRCIQSGAYLIETLESLSESLTYTSTQLSTTIINYVVTETEPQAGTLTAVSNLFTLFGFTVV